LRKVIVEAPASSANLGPGFDVFALALKFPNDRVEVKVEEESGPTRLTLDSPKNLPADVRKNSVGVVADSIIEKHRIGGKINLRLVKGVPVAVGLGSSGASSVATAVAIDKAFNLRMTVGELIEHASAGEKLASGSRHLDNVTASLMGGFVIVPNRNGSPPISFKSPPSLRLAAVTPQVSLPRRKTEYARSLLPKEIPIAHLVRNVTRASVIVAGFAKRDVRLIGQGMEDAVVEPARAKMVPGIEEVRTAAKEAGAAGICISGAGPTMVSFVDADMNDPQGVLGAMIDAFRVNGIQANGFVTSTGKGARIIESS